MAAPPPIPPSPPTLLVPPSQLVPHSRPTKERLILNSFFSCGSHRICICPSLAGPAPSQLLRASQAAGSSGLGPEPAGYTGRERKGTERADQKREGEGAGHRGNLHIPSSPGHQTNSVAGVSKSESGLPRCQEPAAAEAMSAPGWPTRERSGKTHSIAELPGSDAARPLVQPASVHSNWPSPCLC